MSYARQLRRLLIGFEPELEHLYLLEPFQIGQVASRIGMDGLARLVQYDPVLRRVLAHRSPQLEEPLRDALDELTLSASTPPTEAVLWEIADLLVYNVSPDLFDAVVPSPPVQDVLRLAPMSGTVADVGAGTGRLALALARHVDEVYAVEPVSALRRFCLRQRDRLGIGHVHVVDGFLHRLPFPDSHLDGLVTRSALGWYLKRELAEIDRVIGPGACVVHLTGIPMDEDAGAMHTTLVERGYTLQPYREGRTPSRAYVR